MSRAPERIRPRAEGPQALVAVVPAFNEVATIRSVVRRLLPYVGQVLVVDDGSTDGTAGQLSGLPVSVMRLGRNQGKGTALREGFRWGMQRGAAIVTLDADGQHQPEDIPLLWNQFAAHPEAIVIGARLRDVDRIPVVRRLAHVAARFWISLASGRAIQDTQSGLRLYPVSALSLLMGRCDWTSGFALESELLIEAGRLKVPIHDVPIAAIYSGRLRRSHYRQFRDTWAITRMVTGKILSSGLFSRRVPAGPTVPLTPGHPQAVIPERGL